MPPDLPAGLVWYPADRPGIRRQRRGRGFSYLAPDGTRIDDAAERARLNGLGVPPAWADVWLCPRRRGHLQARGRDAARRLQYRYHPRWTEARSEAKFDRLPEFGAALPDLREWIRRGLGAPAGSRRLALATVLRLMDRAAIRVGGDSPSARGATTLRPRDAWVDGARIALRWTAKGGQDVRKRLTDRRLARALHRSADLPGCTLARWTDEDGRPREVRSEEVNETLRFLAGDGMTAKTFRTWNGSLAALEAAEAAERPTIGAMCEAAAARLHNTPAIARSSYVHPAVLDLARERPVPRGGPRTLIGAERRLARLAALWREAG